MKHVILELLLALCVFFTLVLTAPKPTPSPSSTPSPAEAVEPDLPDPSEPVNTGLFYDEYLQQVVKLLESNEEFKKRMQDAAFDDIKSGKLSEHVNFMPEDIREKLNNLKKQEISRLRKIVQAKTDLDNGRKVKNTQHLTQIANHLDHSNPHTFEAADLTNLIKAATSDLENYDQERHEDFKKYEMNKELQREEKLKKLNEMDRQKAREEYIQKQKELAENSAIHHPGSKAQLEEVWNEEDGLAEQEFNPKTFFNLHDMNDDGYLDGMELEALFEKDLEAAYNTSDPGFDGMQMEEERRRMREHVVKEVDKNEDGLVSLEEFLTYTNTEEFETPDEDSYKTIDQLLLEHSLYSKDELEKYRLTVEQHEADIKAKLDVLKAEAKNLGGLRKELIDEQMEANKDGLQEDEKIRIQVKEKQVKQQEEKLQTIHKELQAQSKEMLEMKQEVQKHEAGKKIAAEMKEKLDSLPPGEEKNKAVEEAHERLDALKKAQGIYPENNPDLESPPPPQP